MEKLATTGRIGNNGLRQSSSNKIDYRDLLLYLLHRWYLMLIGFLVGACALGAFTWFQPDTYTSTASLFIQPESVSTTDMEDIQLGNALSSGYVELASCKAVLDTTIEEIQKENGTELTREYLKSCVTITNTSDSRLLVFSVTTDDAELSRAIAETMADATAQQVSVILSAEEPKFVDHAETGLADDKHLLKKTATGGIVGATLVCIILMEIYLLNDMVVTEEDLKKYFNVNVLGTISVDPSKTYKEAKAKNNKRDIDESNESTQDEGYTSF